MVIKSFFIFLISSIQLQFWCIFQFLHIFEPIFLSQSIKDANVALGVRTSWTAFQFLLSIFSKMWMFACVQSIEIIQFVGGSDTMIHRK